APNLASFWKNASRICAFLCRFFFVASPLSLPPLSLPPLSKFVVRMKFATKDHDKGQATRRADHRSRPSAKLRRAAYLFRTYPPSADARCPCGAWLRVWSGRHYGAFAGGPLLLSFSP